MNSVPKGERMNICFLGKINAGKSSIINSLVGQDVSIVSEQPGTTTDPVAKRYELIPVGPVTIYDTAGYDDETILGEKRVRATLKIMFRTDLAVLVLDNHGLNEIDVFYVNKLEEMKIPFIVVWNKSDIVSVDEKTMKYFSKKNVKLINYSVKKINETMIDLLKNEIIDCIQKLSGVDNYILRDIISRNDLVVLVIPIDSSAPKGRIILPQVQVLREVLDSNAIAVSCTEFELSETLNSLNKRPKLVITDSQAIELVNKIVPKEILLTTFSTLFARYRGELFAFLEGLKCLKNIKQEDEILIAESCSHHSMGDDIGLYKIPEWIRQYLGFKPKFTKVNGHDFPEDLEKYKLVIHCGGCMMTRMEILRRINECQRRGVAITNYGVLISEVHGSLNRVIKVFQNK